MNAVIPVPPANSTASRSGSTTNSPYGSLTQALPPAASSRSMRVVKAPLTAYVIDSRSRSSGELAIENTRDSGQKPSASYGSRARCRNCPGVNRGTGIDGSRSTV